MKVLIGVDPHKGSHTAVAIDGNEVQLGELRVRATKRQCELLLSWAEAFPERRWAIESAGGLGYLLGQQLVAAGENVVDVPPTLSARVRVLGSGKFAAAINPRYRALVLVGGYGGLRIGEMAGLRRSRVDVLRSRLDVVEKIVEVRGELLVGGPKTRAGRRQVPLPRPVAEELAIHLERFVAPESDALVFAGPDGGALRARQWRARHCAPAIREAGVAPLRPHDLRHTAVALWIAQGASPKQIATWAGHTSVSVVLDRYGHLFPGHEASVMERLEAGYAAPSTPARGELRALPGVASTTPE